MSEESPNISKEEFEAIEMYLLDRMLPSEKQDFEAKMSDNEALASAVDEQRTLIAGIEEKSLKKRLEGFHDEVKEENNVLRKKVIPLRSRRWYYMAASIAVLFALGSIWYFSRPPEHERLFNQYFSPDPGLPTVMGTTDNYAFYEAMVEYKRGDYEAAIQKWEKLYAVKPQNDTLNYFIGVAYLANNDPAASIPFLKKALSTSESLFNEEAAYFLALSHLQKNQLDSAKRVLRERKLAKAKRLLQDLNNR